MGSEIDAKALWSCSYGIYVVTSCYDGKSNGQITNTVIQVTAEPPRIAVAINKENYTHGFINDSGSLAVSVLNESTPMKFIGGFGFKTGREFEKLTGVEAYKGVTGCPVVTENAVSVFEGRVFERVDVGTHTLFVADVVSGRVLANGKPLTYAQYHANKGKTPEHAPTYRPPEAETPAGKVPAAGGGGAEAKEGIQRQHLRGMRCVYRPPPRPRRRSHTGTPFDDLPGWVLPLSTADEASLPGVATRAGLRDTFPGHAAHKEELLAFG